MSGVPDDWARHHHLTPRLNFSHNLSGVFPPELYDEHPEFFPLERGKRLRPPEGSGFWNPDIAREDAALHAAAVARKYFDANPGEVSYPLGVNDALIWGESVELISLTSGRREFGNQEGQNTRGPEAQNTGRPEGQSSRGPEIQKPRGPEGQNSRSPGDQSPASEIPEFRNSDSPNWFRERPNYSNLVFTFMNRVAGELAKTHPTKYVGALAYYWAESAPDFPLHPQVIPFLTADRAQGYDATARREELELQEQWGKVAGFPEGRNSRAHPAQNSRGPEVRNSGIPDLRTSGTPDFRTSGLPRRLGIYDYLYGSGYRIPRIWTKLLAEHLRHARRSGFTDYYAEVSPNWGLDGPMPWLTAQLLQDPEQSEAALLDEYYRRYFREAEGPMRRFFERCEELWMAQPGPPYWLKHFRNESQAVIFSSAECRALREMLNQALLRVGETSEAGIPEVLNSGEKLRQDSFTASTAGILEFRVSGIPVFHRAGLSKIRARVQLVSEAFGVTERFVAFQEARVRLTRMALSGSGGAEFQRPEFQRTEVRGQKAEDGGSGAAGAAVGRLPSVVDTRTAWVAPGPSLFAHDLATALGVYLDARREYIRYTLNLARAEPLAVRAYGWDDYLRNDPVPLALMTLRKLGWTDRRDAEGQRAGRPEGRKARGPEGQRNGGAEGQSARGPEPQSVGDAGRVGTGALEFRTSGIPNALAEHPSAAALWEALSESGPLEFRNSGIPIARELLRNPAMTGILLPGRTIAGLPYGIALPAGWFSRVEPAEHHRAALTGPNEARVLKISGSKESIVSQWTRVGGAGLHRARISVRGHVSPGTAVALVFSWLNAGERHVGSATVRLPDGAWPEWVTLEQAGVQPPGAVWVGLGLRVQHQVAGDWIEAKGFSLTGP